METQFVCSVNKENKLSFYRLHTIWSDNKVKLNVVSNDAAAWVGEVFQEKLAETSKLLNISKEKYMEDCKLALTTNGGLSTLLYAVENVECTKHSFVWKKIVDEDSGVKIKLGSIPLEPADFVQTIQNMMNVALDTNKSLLERLHQTGQEKVGAESNVNELLKKLEKGARDKKNIETELMTRFLAVLNAKKKKIALLEEEILKLKAASPSKKFFKTRKRYKLETKDDIYGDETDEDVPGSSRRIQCSNSSNICTQEPKDCVMSDLARTTGETSTMYKDQVITGENVASRQMPSGSEALLSYFFDRDNSP